MIRQAFTCPPYGNSHLACNVGNYTVAVAPVQLDDELELKRISAEVSLSSAVATKFACALYRAKIGPFDVDKPTLTNGQINYLALNLMSFLGVFDHADTTAARFNMTLPVPVLLSPKNQYFIAYCVSSSSRARWLSSVDTLGGGPLLARPTTHTMTSSTLHLWPSQLTMTRQGISMPSFTLRSPEGIYLLGDGYDD